MPSALFLVEYCYTALSRLFTLMKSWKHFHMNFSTGGYLFLHFIIWPHHDSNRKLARNLVHRERIQFWIYWNTLFFSAHQILDENVYLPFNRSVYQWEMMKVFVDHKQCAEKANGQEKKRERNWRIGIARERRKGERRGGGERARKNAELFAELETKKENCMVVLRAFGMCHIC